jgi:hypothetical protein
VANPTPAIHASADVGITAFPVSGIAQGVFHVEFPDQSNDNHRHWSCKRQPDGTKEGPKQELNAEGKRRQEVNGAAGDERGQQVAFNDVSDREDHDDPKGAAWLVRERDEKSWNGRDNGAEVLDERKETSHYAQRKGQRNSR